MNCLAADSRTDFDSQYHRRSACCPLLALSHFSYRYLLLVPYRAHRRGCYLVLDSGAAAVVSADVLAVAAVLKDHHTLPARMGEPAAHRKRAG